MTGRLVDDPNIAKAVADERRRIAQAIEGERRSTPDADEYSIGYETAINNCLRICYVDQTSSGIRRVDSPNDSRI
jgi:hypothetical protein